MFATVGTALGNRSIGFPARMPIVVPVASSDGKGNISSFSPPPQRDMLIFATLGEKVKSARLNPSNPEEFEVRLSGSSIAVMLATAVAAMILQFAFDNLPFKAVTLRTRHGMVKVLSSISKQRNDYYYIPPWIAMDERDPKQHFRHLLKQILDSV